MWWGVWPVEGCVGEEEDSLLTDNESYANQLATTPYANMAIVEMKGLVVGIRQLRAFKVDPRISLIGETVCPTICPGMLVENC